MGPEAGVRPATFGEFGVALITEVFNPWFLQHQLNAAFDSLLEGVDWLPEFPADIASVRAGTPSLIEDDGAERRYAVTVYAALETGVGPRSLAVDIEVKVEIDLTMRVGTFRPAIVRLDIDPVAADDFQVRTSTRSDWLPLSLLDVSGGSRLERAAQRSLPIFAAAVNRMVAASAHRRQVDVLARVRRSQGVWGGQTSVEPRSGTLEPGENVRWSIELGEQERARLQLWAGMSPESDTGRAGSTRPSVPPESSTVPSVHLSLHEAGGTLVDELTLAVRRAVPDFDTSPTGVAVTATSPSAYRAGLGNGGSTALSYRVEERRDIVAGERTTFAEFGEVLIRRGIDRGFVTNAINAQLTGESQVIFDAPMLLRGSVAARLSDVTAVPAGPDELRFELSLEITVEFRLGPGANATVVSSMWRATVSLRVSTLVNPVTLLVRFEPVSRADLLLVQRPRRVSGRRLPVPHRALTELAPEQIRTELNRRLAQASRRLTVSELAAELPAGFAETSLALPARTSFAGVVSTGRPARHPLQLAERQRIRAKARVVARASERADGEGARPSDLAAELAVCDERGGVWVTDQASIPRSGEPTIMRVDFTVPQTGQWRLRVTSTGGHGLLEYELQVRPQARAPVE
jgi:hypothetical protein